MSQKRERSVNFTRDEIDILVKLVEEYKQVLENKKSDAVIWGEKEQCWKTIEASFNCASGVIYRNSKTLRLKYEGIKRDTRKKSALIRAETYRTGGGPSTAPILTPSEVKIKDMILLSVDGMESIFDCDHAPNAVVSLEQPQCSMEKQEIDFKSQNSDEVPRLSIDTEQTQSSEIIIEKTPVRPIKRTLFDNQAGSYLNEQESGTNKKWAQWKPDSLRSKKHPALSKPKPKRPFEKVADMKLEVVELQKTLISEELTRNRIKWSFEEKEREQQQKKWDFEEEERQHKREMWALEKKIMIKKLNDQ